MPTLKRGKSGTICSVLRTTCSIIHIINDFRPSKMPIKGATLFGIQNRRTKHQAFTVMWRSWRARESNLVLADPAPSSWVKYATFYRASRGSGLLTASK